MNAPQMDSLLLTARNGAVLRISLNRPQARNALSSALMGALQMIIGSTIMALAGLFANGRPEPMTFGIAVCAVAAFLVTQFALRRVAAATALNPSTS